VKISYNMWMTFFLNCQHWRWDLDICEWHQNKWQSFLWKNCDLLNLKKA
jgi:hypothetical protein